MIDPRKVDIYSAEHKRDPFPFYALLRSEARSSKSAYPS